MQTRDFCFWLQGFFELTPTPNGLTAQQAELIKAHLDLVFKHDVRIKTKEMEHPAPVREVRITPIDFQGAAARPWLDGVATC